MGKVRGPLAHLRSQDVEALRRLLIFGMLFWSTRLSVPGAQRASELGLQGFQRRPHTSDQDSQLILSTTLDSSRAQRSIGFATAVKMQKSCGPTTMNSLRTARRTLINLSRRQNLQDITITRTGKPIIRTQGGRSVILGNL
jgi:hypothetical protein